MQTFFAGTDVTVAILLADTAGEAVTGITSATYTVTDAAGEEIVASAAATFDPDTSIATITIPAASNVLDADEIRDARVVNVLFVSPTGTRIASETYIIEATDVLTVGLNSFMPYSQVILRMLDLSNIAPFAAANKEQRTPALLNAFNNICNLQFTLGSTPLKDLATLTKTQIEGLPARFLKTLQLAQILEANELLDVNSPSFKRREGIMSETIGESSMMFRPGKPIVAPVCSRAMDLLQNYITWEVGLGRG